MEPYLKFSNTLVVFFCLIFFGITLAPFPSNAEGRKLYTAYNIWVHGNYTMKFVNFKEGRRFIPGGIRFVPAGTEVTKVKIGEEMIIPSDVTLFVSFTRNDGNRNFYDRNFVKSYNLYFEKRFHPNKSIEEYKDLTFTARNFAELTKGFTQNELDAVKQGKIVDGMRRQAVLVSYGYPPENKTKDLSETTWTYSITKRKSKVVQFDENGFTINTGNPGIGNSRSDKSIGESSGSSSTSGYDDLLERLETLNKMLENDLITQEEFVAKKKELLQSL